MITNLTFFDESKADDEQERQMLAQWNANANLARSLHVFNRDLQVVGSSKSLIDGDHGCKILAANGEVWLNYKRGTYLNVTALEEMNWFSLKAIWTEPSMRHQGHFREVVRILKDYALEKKLGCYITANPFTCSGWDQLLLDLEDMEYVQEPHRRDQTAQMLLSEGFIECPLLRFHMDDMEPLLVRIVRDYKKLIPRMFLFNCEGHEHEEFNESVYENQLKRVEKDLEESPDKYGEFGHRKSRFW